LILAHIQSKDAIDICESIFCHRKMEARLRNDGTLIALDVIAPNQI
jgi:hypothetical protein